MTRYAPAILFVLASVALYGVAHSSPALWGWGYIASHAVMAGVMLGTWWQMRRSADLHAANIVILAGLVARIALIGVPTFTTHDVDRYLWDGAVLASGMDPYGVTPQSAGSLLDALREQWFVAPEHRAYTTVYPPLALWAFALCSMAGPWAWLGWKVLCTGASIAILALAGRLLVFERRLHHLPLVAFNPLLVLESGVGAHIDILAAAMVAWGIYAWRLRRDEWLVSDEDRALVARRRMWVGAMAAGVAIGLGGGFKFLPLLLGVPWLVEGTPRERVRLVAGAVGATLLLYGTVMLWGAMPPGDLGVFAAKWRFGSPLGVVMADWPEMLRFIVSGAWLVGTLGAGALLAHTGRGAEALFVVLGVVLVGSSVVFPWYLACAAVALVLAPHVLGRVSAFGWAWLLLLPLTYEAIGPFESEGVWEPAVWPLVVLVLGWAAVLAPWFPRASILR